MNTRNIKYTIGGPESTPGSAVSRTAALPIREKPGFREQAEKLTDPAIVGRNMVAGEYTGARNLNGPLPISPRPCAGFGMLLNSLLGQEERPVKVVGVVRVRYTGAEASAKIFADPATGILTSQIGDLGSETDDAAFGTAGDIDLADSATDTLAELVAVIDAYATYEAELVMGDNDTASAGVVLFAAQQGAGRWVYLYFAASYALARIRYVGTEASCLIVSNTTADTLTATVGDLGDEGADANFGTAGEIDLTAVATDTVGELVAVIDAYATYEAELIAGDPDTDAGDILSFTATQAADGWVYLVFDDSEPGLYLHQWPVDLSNDQRPTYSVQGDGIHDNYLGVGVGVDAMTISGALKAMVEAEATAAGFTWTAGQTASVVELEAVDPFLYYNGSFSIDGTTQPFVRNVSVEISNNGNAEGYGMGSVSRQYHDKGEFTATITVQIRYSADVYALYAKLFSNAQAGVDFYFRTPAALTLGPEDESLYGMLIIEVPYCNVSDYEATDNSGVLDASINLRAINPPGQYGSPFRISMITDDSGAY